MITTLLFDELLDRLRREGFSVGTDQYLRMNALFERHAEASPEELKTLLCPIFAMSAVEQQRFHQAYAEFFAARSGGISKQTMAGTIARRLTLVAQRLPEPVKPPPAVRWKMIVAIAASITALLVAVLTFWPSNEAQRVLPDAPPPVTVTDTVRDRPIGTPPSHSSWLLAAATFAFLIFVAEVARTLLRFKRQHEHRTKGRPFDWPVRDPQPTAPRLFAHARFFGAARLMKGREIGEARRLDVPRSILATIRSLGDPVFEYRHDRRVTEYLFLVERRSERDHLAAFVQASLDALARDGVLVEVYEHDGDPRHCWKPGTSGRIVTADLQSRFPQHRLVIVGSAPALTHPVTGEALDSIPRLFPWNWRAILTPGEETLGIRRFSEYFDVYALADNGLARLAERWQQTDAPPQRRRAAERRRNLSDLPSSPDELERELDPLIFRWLLRCAVHPTLHWDLTRALAPPLPAAEHEAALLDLARLEWFRQGRIPEPERLALVSRLAEDEPEELAARTTAARVLAAAPAPPAESMAARVFEIQQLAHQIWSARDRPSELRPLLRRLRHFPPSQVARDGALLMLLQEAPGTLLMHTLPQSLRRFLFRQGIPAFGMKNFVALAAVMPVMLFAANAMLQKPVPVAAAEPPPITEPSPAPPGPSPRPEVKPPAVKPEIADAPVVIDPTVIADEKPAVVTPPPTPKPKREPKSESKTPEIIKPKSALPPPYEVPFATGQEAPIRTIRTIETALPVSCSTTEGTYKVDLRLTPRETFESAEVTVLNKEAFTVAEVKPTDGASYSYRFVARQPCDENKLMAYVRVRASLGLAKK